MSNNQYSGINNRYQYTQDALRRSQEDHAAAKGGIQADIASRYAGDDIRNESMSKFADTFGEQGYSGLFKAGISGFASGSKAGTAKNKESEKRERFEETKAFFEDTDRELRQNLKEMEIQEAAKEKIKPYALAYLNRVFEGDGTVTPAMETQLRNMIEMGNKYAGENVEYRSVDPRNPTKIFVYDKDKDMLLEKDIRVMFAGSTLQENELATKQASYLEEIDRKSREEDRKNQIEQDKLNQDIRKNSPNAKFNNKAAELEAERLKDVAVKANETIYSASKVNEILGEMKKIADDNPEIFNSMLTPVWSNPEHTAINIIAKKLSMFDKDNEKTSTALSDIEKRTNELVAMGAKGFGGRANVFIEKIFQSSTPNAGMAKGAFYSVTNDMIEKNNKDIESGYSILKDYNSKLSHTGVDQFQGSFGGNNSGASNQIFDVKSPNGQVKKVPLNQLQQTIEKGGVIIYHE